MTSIVIGDDVGIAGVVLSASEARLRDAHFDNDTDSWMVVTPDGRSVTARTLIDSRPSDDGTVATHGMPNFFRVPGPHPAQVARQSDFVRRCLALLDHPGATRIEAKSRIVLRRWRPQRVEGRFYLTGSVPRAEDLYDGDATITIADSGVGVRARLTGHVDAIDGQYHWRGTIAGDLPDDLLKRQRMLDVSIARTTAHARLVERTPWGGYTVAGVGAPPFALD